MHRTRNPRHHRRLAAVSAATMLGLALSACSGGTGVAGIGGAPEDASVDDFCEAYTSLQDDLVSGFDLSAPEDEQTQRAVEVLQGWAGQLEEVGTPSDIPEEARQGYELIIETAQDLPEDATASDFTALEEDFSDSQNEAADAFGEYAGEECPVSLPSELPSGVPSELPSDLSTEDLPSDLPTELLSQLPSDLSTEDLPSDFPTELLSEPEYSN